MNARSLLATVSGLAVVLASSSALAGGLRAGVNVPCLEKAVKGDKPPATAWIALGYLDQVRGDPKAAAVKYQKAFEAGADDLANAPLDLTLVNDVIWIQNDLCKVPVPAQGDAPAATKVPPFDEPKYPPVLSGIGSDGNASVTAVIGVDGHPTRVTLKSASAGPAQVVRTYTRPGEELSDRLVARVQFALVTMQTIKDMKFPDGNSGKLVEWTAKYVPPKDLLSENRLPGKPDTTQQQGTQVQFGGAGSGGRHP